MLTNTKLQQTHINHVISFGNAYPITKIPDGFRSITSPSHATDCWHSRIIPSVNIFLSDQLKQFSFAHYTVGQIPSCEFILMGWKNFQLLDQPVIQFTMRYKFKRTNRVSYI